MPLEGTGTMHRWPTTAGGQQDISGVQYAVYLEMAQTA